MIRCLITDGTASENEARWLDHAAHWLAEGVELLQIRERELSTRALAELTRKVLRLANRHVTKILVNDRADVALACGADGVHLRDGSADAAVFRRPGFLVSVACHSVAAVKATLGADFIVLAPIFSPLSKQDSRLPLGPAALAEASRATSIPVLALGGITRSNARLCLEAGAAGVAGISYFNGRTNRPVLASAPH